MTGNLSDSPGIGRVGFWLQWPVGGSHSRVEFWVSWLHERCSDTRVTHVDDFQFEEFSWTRLQDECGRHARNFVKQEC